MDDSAFAFTLVTRLTLGSILSWSGITKLGAGSMGVAISRYGILPARVARALAAILPPLELVLGALLLFGAFVPLALLVSALLISAFAAAMLIALRTGRAIPCGCFGDRSALIGPGTIMRNILLIIAAAAASYVAYSLDLSGPAAAWDMFGRVQTAADLFALVVAIAVGIAVFLALPELDTVRAWRIKHEGGRARWSRP